MSAKKRFVKIKKAYICIFVLLTLLCTVSGCITDAKYQKQYVGVFDTVVQIMGYENNKQTFDKNSELIYNKLYEYHKLFDIYNVYDGINNIKTINDNAGISPVEVEPQLIELLDLAIEMYNITDGRLNIAMGSVLNLWQNAFYASQNGEQIDFPNDIELKNASEHCDIQNIIIDREKSTVYISDKYMSIDVGAVAKGFAVEKVYEYAQSFGLKSYLLNVGGNVRAFGKKADGGMWNIGINDPFAEGTIFNVKAANTSVVTSGGYNRYFTYNGKKYHHIIDPKTLCPSGYCASVTVVCENSGVADALSTALFNMSVDEGIEFTESLDGVEACYVTNNGEFFYTSGFLDFRAN